MNKELAELADELGAYSVPDGDIILADLLFRAEEAIRCRLREQTPPDCTAQGWWRKAAAALEQKTNV